ncbi:MAG: type IV pilus assembly protein PilM, partial [Armatimonadetes bacterium]|nr:type IV pilus assembly protein PilM [Armatimonadota bacterium]
VLRGMTVIPTPAAAVVNNEIVDPVTLGKTIRQALNQAGIRSKQAVIAVAGQSALVVRIIEVPRMTRAELDETMKWEIERHVPFAAEQTVKAYLPITPPEDVPEGQNMEVLLAVAQESLVNRHLETLQAAGLKVVAVEIEPLASPRALIDISNGVAPSGTVALVDIGASTTDVGIYREGILAFTRTIQIAGNNLTKAIADTLTRPLQEAEDLKRQRAAVPEQPGNFGQQDDFGGLGPLDFGVEPDEAPLGGTFGVAPSADPGASTASDTHSEATIDVAGSGFSTDAFTSPAPESSPFGLPGAAPAPNPFGEPPVAAASDTPSGGGAGLFGPAPQGNPFGGDATNLFGPTPQAAPFGLTEDVFGGPPGGGPPGAGTAQMSEEEFLQAQINDAIMPVLNELVTELQRSLEFFRNRASGAGAQQILLTGGSARLRGLANFLSANLGIPVAVGDPLQYVTTGPKADPAMVSEYGPAFPVSVGLAVRELLQDPPQARKKR